ncbi:MAG: TerC family protein [Chlamydiia bacterium]|nr:TerC family protein [Chlamydiia bacterium]
MLIWIAFNIALALFITIDLNFRKGREMNTREGLRLTALWFVLAMLFNIFIAVAMGKQAALEFFAGYLIEQSLSIDNLFVFIAIFNYFAVSIQQQSKVLFWGVIGALAMRLGCIFAGISLIHTFTWIFYVFGAFLIGTGIYMFQKKADATREKSVKPFKSQFLAKFIPFHGSNEDDQFFVKKAGKWLATPLFSVLLTVELTDLLFALDSIPAIFGVTQDPFIVYSSNAFAILGLRSLYFALQGSLQYFTYLHYGVSAVLIFIGVKMLLMKVMPIPIVTSLVIIALILAASMLLSVIQVKDRK